MNNYKSYKPDEVPDVFCEDCGKKIDETQIFAEATEFQEEVFKCEDCFIKQEKTRVVIL